MSKSISTLSKMWLKVKNIAKSVYYNLQTTRDLIDRLRIDRTLRVLCGWRHSNSIPSESKFSRVFKELCEMKIAEKTQVRMCMIAL